jgi:hypothetical protein
MLLSLIKIIDFRKKHTVLSGIILMSVNFLMKNEFKVDLRSGQSKKNHQHYVHAQEKNHFFYPIISSRNAK